MKEESIARLFRNGCLLLILPASFLIWTSFAVSAGTRLIL